MSEENGEEVQEPANEPLTDPQTDFPTEEFEFYFSFTKPLVLDLPSSEDRAIAAAWVQKVEAKPVSETEEQRVLRLNYLKLLLFVLQRGRLSGIFKKQPPSGPLQPFPQGFSIFDMGNWMLEQDDGQSTGAGDARSVPYNIDMSNNLREFVATQEIPNFGIQMYYAWSSDEPIHKWMSFDEEKFPQFILDKIKQLKEIKSEEKNAVGKNTCKKKQICDFNLPEKGSRKRVKSPQEIERSQGRSFHTYMGLVGRMGNFNDKTDEDPEKFQRQDQRRPKCKNRSPQKKCGPSGGGVEDVAGDDDYDNFVNGLGGANCQNRMAAQNSAPPNCGRQNCPEPTGGPPSAAECRPSCSRKGFTIRADVEINQGPKTSTPKRRMDGQCPEMDAPLTPQRVGPRSRNVSPNRTCMDPNAEGGRSGLDPCRTIVNPPRQDACPPENLGDMTGMSARVNGLGNRMASPAGRNGGNGGNGGPLEVVHCYDKRNIDPALNERIDKQWVDGACERNNRRMDAEYQDMCAREQQNMSRARQCPPTPRGGVFKPLAHSTPLINLPADPSRNAGGYCPPGRMPSPPVDMFTSLDYPCIEESPRAYPAGMNQQMNFGEAEAPCRVRPPEAYAKPPCKKPPPQAVRPCPNPCAPGPSDGGRVANMVNMLQDMKQKTEAHREKCETGARRPAADAACYPGSGQPGPQAKPRSPVGFDNAQMLAACNRNMRPQQMYYSPQAKPNQQYGPFQDRGYASLPGQMPNKPCPTASQLRQPIRPGCADFYSNRQEATDTHYEDMLCDSSESLDISAQPPPPPPPTSPLKSMPRSVPQNSIPQNLCTSQNVSINCMPQNSPQNLTSQNIPVKCMPENAQLNCTSQDVAQNIPLNRTLQNMSLNCIPQNAQQQKCTSQDVAQNVPLNRTPRNMSLNCIPQNAQQQNCTSQDVAQNIPQNGTSRNIPLNCIPQKAQQQNCTSQDVAQNIPLNRTPRNMSLNCIPQNAQQQNCTSQDVAQNIPLNRTPRNIPLNCIPQNAQQQNCTSQDVAQNIPQNGTSRNIPLKCTPENAQQQNCTSQDVAQDCIPLNAQQQNCTSQDVAQDCIPLNAQQQNCTSQDVAQNCVPQNVEQEIPQNCVPQNAQQHVPQNLMSQNMLQNGQENIPPNCFVLNVLTNYNQQITPNCMGQNEPLDYNQQNGMAQNSQNLQENFLPQNPLPISLHLQVYLPEAMAGVKIAQPECPRPLGFQIPAVILRDLQAERAQQCQQAQQDDSVQWVSMNASEGYKPPSPRDYQAPLMEADGRACRPQRSSPTRTSPQRTSPQRTSPQRVSPRTSPGRNVPPDSPSEFVPMQSGSTWSTSGATPGTTSGTTPGTSSGSETTSPWRPPYSSLECSRGPQSPVASPEGRANDMSGIKWVTPPNQRDIRAQPRPRTSDPRCREAQGSANATPQGIPPQGISLMHGTPRPVTNVPCPQPMGPAPAPSTPCPPPGGSCPPPSGSCPPPSGSCPPPGGSCPPQQRSPVNYGPQTIAEYQDDLCADDVAQDNVCMNEEEFDQQYIYPPQDEDCDFQEGAFILFDDDCGMNSEPQLLQIPSSLEIPEECYDDFRDMEEENCEPMPPPPQNCPVNRSMGGSRSRSPNQGQREQSSGSNRNQSLMDTFCGMTIKR